MTVIVNPPAAGSGASSIADGADVAQGARADTAWDNAAGSTTLMGTLKRIALNLGLPSESAWAGSGDGSVIGILKSARALLNTLAGAITSGRMNSNIQRTSASSTVSIASGQTKSGAIDISKTIAGTITTPTAMTGSSFTYEVAYTVGGTHYPLRDQYGGVVTTAISTSAALSFPLPVEAAGAASLIVVSSATELSARTLSINLKG